MSESPMRLTPPWMEDVSMARLLKLNVGCGTNPKPGFVNCDFVKHPGVDVVFDLQERWPFEDNSVSVLTAYHVLEHVADWAAFFKEAWRVLAPGGTVSLQLPYGASIDGMAEPGHVRYWLPTSFAVLQPDYAEAVGNLQHQHLSASFEITFVGACVNKNLMWMVRRPWRKYGLRALWYLFGGHNELIVGMRALKTQEAVEDFVQRNPRANGSVVPLAQCVWLHYWDPKAYERRGRPADIVILGEGVGMAKLADTPKEG